jgi:Lipocalin-like domain
MASGRTATLSSRQRSACWCSSRPRNARSPKTDEHRVAAFRSKAAYSGIYRVKGDRWIAKVDVAWDESWMGTEQVRFFRIEGEQPNGHHGFSTEPQPAGEPWKHAVC